METLSGKTAVITGGGGAIAAATARDLTSSGAHVVLADIDAERVSKVADQVRSLGGESIVVVNSTKADPATFMPAALPLTVPPLAGHWIRSW